MVVVGGDGEELTCEDRRRSVTNNDYCNSRDKDMSTLMTRIFVIRQPTKNCVIAIAYTKDGFRYGCHSRLRRNRNPLYNKKDVERAVDSLKKYGKYFNWSDLVSGDDAVWVSPALIAEMASLQWLEPPMRTSATTDEEYERSLPGGEEAENTRQRYMAICSHQERIFATLFNEKKI